MITNELNTGLVNAVREKLPSKENLANTLMDILYIGKEAIYRRLRGEVPFTLTEAAIISRKLGISLDKMIGVSFQDNAVFDMNIVSSSKPLETYYSILEKQVELFRKVKDEEYSEIGTSSNIIPLTLSLNYNMLSKFRLFKWMYQNENIKCKHFEEMEKLLKVSSSPHVRDGVTTQRLMFDVVIAMIPASVYGVWQFGMNALLVLIATVIASVAAEYLYEKLMHKPITISDGSAVVTGMIFALNMPPEIPVWIPVLGAFFAIIVVKQLFGGLGQNFMNPALAARCFLLICFTQKMTYFVYDGVTGATPLAQLKSGNVVNTMDMLLGNVRGTIGETSVIAIMIGAMFLILTGVIDLRIPGSYIVSFVIFITLFGGNGFDPWYITAHLCGGGLMLGAWFMATDYVTAPITSKGKILYGICMGILTGLFRLFGASAEGVSYAIIISNLLVPLIEKVTLPKPFGKGGEK